MKNRWIRRVGGLVFASILGIAPIAWSQSAKHVIIISIDGLHQADLNDPALRDQLSNVLGLVASGLSYSQASGTEPSDSYPGTLAYLTGAGPATTGVYYDESYSRALLPPGSALDAPRGTAVHNAETIDKDQDLINGGGDCGLDSLDPAKLPLDPARNGAQVYPHDYLKVNTIFELAHAAGLRTSMMDKHPSYEIAAGPSGKGIDDLYCPEIEALGVIIDGKLLDKSTAPADTKLKPINKTVPLVMAYDDLKITALVNQIHGMDARGKTQAAMPALVVLNLQSVAVAEKSPHGGIDNVDGKEVPSKELIDALQHVNSEIGAVTSELKSANVWDQTLLIVLAKHGQNPRIGSARPAGKSTIPNALQAAGIKLAGATMDDVGLLWLADRSQASEAARALANLKASSQNPGIAQIYYGDDLQAQHLAGPDDRTPDLIVTLDPGILLIDKPTKKSDHGGFCEDDLHVPLILAGGVIPESRRGAVDATPVKTTQIAVTALQALGLDSNALEGARIEQTQPLPTGDNGATQAKFQH